MIAIIAAMQIECDALLNYMEDVEVKTLHQLVFYEGKLNKHPVVLMLSGVGKVNATMSTTILLDRYQIEYVINIGTAGGLIETQEVLDLVVSDHVIQYDYDTSGIDGESGRGKRFKSDQHLLKIVEAVFKELELSTWVGSIASGDQFICDDHKIDEILNYFPEVICAEMEAGAIAQVCDHFNVAFIVIRSLSDIAHKENSHLDFTTYVKKASERSAIFTKAIIEKL
ncbi:MAG: 5'-methylthioadenosine/adenosylhomocysteine nucleosidase [Erysipelotrichaceae bacterium]